MSANIESKKQLVEEIKAKFEQAKTAVIVNYCGLTVEQDTKLRKSLRENNVEYSVLKNTLVKRALNDLGKTEFDEFLNGPTAVAFSMEDEVAAPRVIAEAVDSTKKMQIKCGMMNQGFITDAEVKALAQIPPREVLIAKILGSMNAPISKLAVALKAISEQK